MYKLYLFTLFFAIAFSSLSQEISYFENPVNRGDFADPSIIRVDDVYYVTATSSEWAPYLPIFTSSDLINWDLVGHVFDEKPQWTSHSFWAPELYYHNNRMYCYYTARRKSDNVSYIGVASAEGISLDFEDHGPIIEYGTEAIDPFVYNLNGVLYITWKAYGLDKRPIELLGSRLSDDGLRLEGEPFSLLKDEGIGLEGQYHFKHGDYYYIIYSAKSCCGPGSDYDVRVARSASFHGPYENYEENPILYGDGGDYISCGHGTVVETPDGRYFYYSHGYQSGDNFFLGRQHIIHELQFTDDGWIEFKTGNIAVNRQPVPFAGTEQKEVEDFRDNFNANELNPEWTWNYPFSDIDIKVDKGSLILSGKQIEDNMNGTVLCLRPQTTRYDYFTKVNNVNGSFKGLTMYGDDKNMVAIGIAGNKIEVKSVRDGEESVLYSSVIKKKKPYFKIEVDKGRFLTFHYSIDGNNWITANDTVFDASHLVRWDRVARPGLIHIGGNNEPAVYDYFQLKNK
ncbi:MAG: family 43 glycosylhydrolase [Fermentimonas sp.]|nr:family 43 glycosylhydrolase [Fermentimonas sp.]